MHQHFSLKLLLDSLQWSLEFCTHNTRFFLQSSLAFDLKVNWAKRTIPGSILNRTIEWQVCRTFFVPVLIKLLANNNMVYSAILANVNHSCCSQEKLRFTWHWPFHIRLFTFQQKEHPRLDPNNKYKRDSVVHLETSDMPNLKNYFRSAMEFLMDTWGFISAISRICRRYVDDMHFQDIIHMSTSATQLTTAVALY